MNFAVVLPVIPLSVLASIPRQPAVGRSDFRPAEEILRAAIEARVFPGCAVVVGTDREVLWKTSLGNVDYEGGGPADTRSLYDLASLTKVVGTTSVALRLVALGEIRLQDKVSTHVPGFRGEGHERVTLEHLLTHSSGLPAWKPLFKGASTYAEIIGKVKETRLDYDPGSRCVYSDLGFILLGELLSSRGGRPLPELERQLVFCPLGMKDTTRTPLRRGADRVVPTEKVGRDGLPPQDVSPGELVTIRGEVHDENARACGGVTGHAGLFSTSEDLAIFARELLRGYRGASQLFPRDVLRSFVARRGLVAGSSRALGWDTPSEGSSAGTLLSEHAFGHTGFTGTSLWIDPSRNIFILLLTNRVHPTRRNLGILSVRRQLADAVVLCLQGRLRSF